jgi:hypothetical protein
MIKELNVMLRITALILVFVINQNVMADTPVEPLVRTTGTGAATGAGAVSRTRVNSAPSNYQATIEALGKIDSSGFLHNQAVYPLEFTIAPLTFVGPGKVELNNDQIEKNLLLLEAMKERRQELANCPHGEAEKIEIKLLDGIVKAIHESFTDSPQESIAGKPQKFIEAKYLALVNTYLAFIKDAKEAGIKIPQHEKIETGLKELMTQLFGGYHESDYDLAKAEAVKDPVTGLLSKEAKEDIAIFKLKDPAKKAIAELKSGNKRLCSDSTVVPENKDKKEELKKEEEEENNQDTFTEEEKEKPKKADVGSGYLPPTEKPKDPPPAKKDRQEPPVPPPPGTNGTGVGGPGNDGFGGTPPPTDPLDPRDFNGQGFNDNLNDDPLDLLLRNLREAGNRTGGTQTGPSFGGIPPFTPPQSKGDTTPQTPPYNPQQPPQQPPSNLGLDRPEGKESQPDWAALYPKEKQEIAPRDPIVINGNPKDDADREMRQFQMLLQLLASNRGNGNGAANGVLNANKLANFGGGNNPARGVSNGPRVAKTSGRKYKPGISSSSNPYAFRNFRGTGTGMQQNGNGDSPRVLTGP